MLEGCEQTGERKATSMNRTLQNGASGISAAIVLGLLLSTNPANAAPVLTSVAGLKAYAADAPTEVRWRGRGAWGAGAIAAGIIAGLAVANAAASPYAYGYGYAPYAYAPGYYGFYGYSPGGRFQDSFRNGY
jgi:hypothetical protein